MGCGEVITYDGLDNHELVCRKCPDCQIKCLTCIEVFDAKEYDFHKCPIQNEDIKIEGV